jgi:uncharacterized membrane protein YgaE (UPF0421/DUF939 family)
VTVVFTIAVCKELKMVIPALTYAVLAITGLLGSVIDWEDLRNLKKPSQKTEVKHP